jgi:hypothetical protein
VNVNWLGLGMLYVEELVKDYVRARLTAALEVDVTCDLASSSAFHAIQSKSRAPDHGMAPL